jgi:hypothetical protein
MGALACQAASSTEPPGAEYETEDQDLGTQNNDAPRHVGARGEEHMSTTTLARTRALALGLGLGLGCELPAALGLTPATPALAAAEPDGAAEVERLQRENEALKRRVEELETRGGAADAPGRGYTVGPPQPPARGAAAAPRLTTISEAGTRTVSTGASRLEVTRGSRAPQWVAFRYERAGDQPVRAITMDLHTQFSGGIYRRVKSLALSVDGDRIDCPVTSYDARPVTGGGPRRRVSRDHEELTVEIPVSALRRMAGAQAVTGSLGPVAFALRRDQLASLRALDESVGN